jgi:uncharacterized membrane protein
MSDGTKASVAFLRSLSRSQALMIAGLRHPFRDRIALAASGWVALALTALPLGSVVRAVAAFLFLLSCPGAALVRHWPVRDRLERAVLAVAVSMASAMLVAEALMVGRAWSAELALVGLAAVTSIAALLPGAVPSEHGGRQ